MSGYYIICDGVNHRLLRKLLHPRKLFHKNRPLLAKFLSTQPEETSQIEEKIIYNSLISKFSFVTKKIIEDKAKRENFQVSQIKPTSYSLKFLTEIPEEKPVQEEIEIEREIKFPYSLNILKREPFLNENENKEEQNHVDWESEKFKTAQVQLPHSAVGKKWMNDYEKYTMEEEEEESSFEEWGLNYGTCNPSVPASNVPCGGCGAYLHSQDFSIPGYIPYEIFKGCNESDLRALTCQRCHFFKNYNTALSVSVDANLYPKLLSKIQNERAMVLLMVDLTDFPCSIWPGILDVIGPKRPIILIGNKVDLLWGDSRGWMEHVGRLLRASLPSQANVQHVHLLSAKTGFGVEELITKLHNIWEYKGDVYLIGCTNVGKSTLFNSLLQSDYCKVKARDLVQRATTSPWPGTTLNLLKFPILRPEGWRLYLRTKRIIDEKNKLRMENKLRKEQKQTLKMKPKAPLQLIGHIGKTFEAKRPDSLLDSFSAANRADIHSTDFPETGLDPNDEALAKSRWFYDTPGVLHPAQNLDLLTTEEIIKTLPKEIIEPRTYRMVPGWTLFIGGLARLDFLEGSKPIRCTVFSSKFLPITICQRTNADEVYNSLVGTDKMGVPIGQGERLKKWPYLQNGKQIVFSGIDEYQSCGDIVFSSSGWVSITPYAKEVCTLLPWTPEARGIHTRVPSLLPFAVKLRGKKRDKLPAYGKTKVPGQL